MVLKMINLVQNSGIQRISTLRGVTGPRPFFEKKVILLKS